VMRFHFATVLALGLQCAQAYMFSSPLLRALPKRSSTTLRMAA